MQENEKERLQNLKKRNRDIFVHSGSFAPDALEMIDSGMARKYSAKRELAKYISITVLAILIMLVCAIGAYASLRVGSISVDNEADFLTEEVIKASGIKKGSTMFFDKEQAEMNIRASIPYASNVVVSTRFPTDVKISIQKAQGVYFTKIGKDCYVLDEECNVVYKTQRIDEIELMNCIEIKSGKISSCVVGKRLLYRDTDMQAVFDELVKLLKEYNYIGFCDAIILDSKFDIMFTYKGRITVELGDLKDLDIKFMFLDKICETLGENDSGIINVKDRNLHEGIVTLY